MSKQNQAETNLNKLETKLRDLKVKRQRKLNQRKSINNQLKINKLEIDKLESEINWELVKILINDTSFVVDKIKQQKCDKSQLKSNDVVILKLDGYIIIDILENLETVNKDYLFKASEYVEKLYNAVGGQIKLSDKL